MTLVELLVTLAILGIVLAVITGAFISGTKAETGVEVRQQAQSDARVALSRMRDDIHCAFDVQSLAPNAHGGYTLSLTEFYNQCGSVDSHAGAGSTVYLAWCTVSDAGSFDLYRENGTCDNTGTLMAADIVSPVGGWPSNQPGNVWPVSRTCVSGYLATQAVDLAVAPDSSAPNERYELKDEIALRNSTRSVGCTGPGAPAQLVFTTQPGAAVPNAAFSTSPVVTAQDGAGNVITNYSGTVALSIKGGTGTSGAVLTGCSAVNLNGATTFTGCKIDKPGTGYVLVAADGAFTVESSPFNVVSGQATTLAVTGYPSPTTSGAGHMFTITAKDSAGNTATGFTGTVHISSSDAAAVLPADYTFVATDNGTRTLNATLMTPGTRSITATDTTASTITGSQTGIVVTAGQAATLIVAGYPNPTVSGVSRTFTVTAKDVNGNIATGYRGTAHFTSSDAAAVLPANYTFTAADNGAHTFNATLKTSGTQSITATDTATSGITGSQTGITVTADTSAPTFVITASGANVITNGTNGVTFKSAAGSSFTITASDPDSGIGSTSFPICPSNWTPTTGTNSVTCNDAPTAAAGSMSVSATNNAGGTTNLTVTITADNTSPTNSLTLGASPSGAYMSAANGTLFYKSNASGSFSLINALSDAGSGPASATFPAITTSGWTHDPETVSTPSGGPYASTTYSWTGSPGSPALAGRTFTGTDVIGNTAATPLTFTADTTAPTAALTFPASGSVYGAGSWTGTIAGSASDGGSGVAQVLVSVKDTTSGKCADATGAFTVTSCTTNFVPAGGTTSWSFAEAASNLTSGDGYTVTVKTIDNVGNTNATAATATWTYDKTGPTPTSVQAVDDNSLGQLTASNGNNHDKAVFTYSENIDPGSITTPNVSVTFTNNDATCVGSADSITVPGIGKACLGSQGWVTSTSTKSEKLSLSANVVTLTITTDPDNNPSSVAASNFTWSTSGGTAADVAGNVAAGSVTTNTQRF